jgi:hypothetical protein
MENSMKKTRLDPNLVATTYDIKGLRFVDALDHAGVTLEGFPYFWENGTLCRLPERIVPTLPDLCQWVCRHPAGGVLRLCTDSPRVALRVRYETGETCVRTPWQALFGWDAYRGSGTKREFMKTLYSLSKDLVLVDGVNGNPGGKLQEWCLYFPVRNHVRTVELGLEKGASLEPPAPRTVEKPILFYGSSIVEGGCASRAGITYPMLVGRDLDAHVINYGFGGSGRGEPEVAQAIADLDLSAVVIDYDHNAPSVEHLKKTHWPFYRTIRRAHPRLPILIVSSVNCRTAPEYFGRRAAVIEHTYTHARAAGDTRVRFLHGKTIWPADRWSDCTIDRTHPNDHGFRLMADAIGKKLGAIVALK